MKKIILLLIIVLFASFTYAVNSTNPADYLAWDDMEWADGINTTIWNESSAGATVSTDRAYSGTQSYKYTCDASTVRLRSNYNVPDAGTNFTYVVKIYYHDFDNQVHGGLESRDPASADYLLFNAGGYGDFNIRYFDGAVFQDSGIDVESAWNEFGITWVEGINATYYMNGIAVGMATNTPTHPTRANIMPSLFFCSGTGTDTIYMDDYQAWAGPMHARPQAAAPPPPTSVIDIILLNSTINEYTSIYEEEDFYIAANYSLSGVSHTAATCNFTGLNISVDFSADSAANYTLNGSVNSLSVTLSEGYSNLIHDNIKFKVCRTNLKEPLNVLVNGSLHETINQNNIPLCSNGFFDYNNITNKYATTRDINLTVSCPTCDNLNNKLVIISDIDKELLHYKREYTSHTEPMSYNSSLNLFIYNSYPYQFEDPGSKNISVYCNGTYKSELFTILNRNISISILSIDDTSYTPGMDIESSNSTRIIISITGDQVSFKQFNVSYSNGSLIKSTIDTIMTLTNDELNVKDYYNISIYARDNNNNIKTLTGNFRINDTVIPTITWLYPSNNATELVNQSFATINISFYDLNLFAYNVSIRSPLGTIYSYDELIGLDGSTVSYSKYMQFNITGQWEIRAIVSDSHTITEIDIYEYEKIDDDLNFIFDDKNVRISYEGIYLVDDIKVDKFKDRYSFEYAFPGVTSKDTVRHVFRLECDNSYYIQQSEYPAHFVCYDALKWVDFNTSSLESYNIYTCGKDCYTIELFTKPDKNIVFNSIGGLNVVEQSKKINVVATPTPGSYDYFLKVGECPTDSVQSVLMFAFIFCVIGTFFYMSKWVLRIPIMTILTCVGGMFFFFSLIACHNIIGVIGIALCVMTAIYEVF